MLEAVRESSTDTQTVAELAAVEAGLRYVSDDEAGIARRRAGTGFHYTRRNGALVREAATLARIRKLAIPPAWTDVWICPSPSGHIQATGRDARGRKQYRYHAQFRANREANKFEHMAVFARALPAIRMKVREQMALPGLPREKVLASVVHLLETTLIRIGNDEYARQNKSFGLTTLKNRHARINGSEVRFQFTGKSGKKWSLGVRDRRVARIIRSCQELPGQQLLQYRDGGGDIHAVSSSDVNDYLQEISGEEITAKDFRTWAGTILAALALNELQRFDSEAQAKRNLKAAIETVAARLGNTPAICRKCYVHPGILNVYLDGNLVLNIQSEVERELKEDLSRLRPEEAAVLALLHGRLSARSGEQSAPPAVGYPSPDALPRRRP
ncbi:DNA topoisomerase [Labrys miyagiensis]|uniref:DNA topoisomerase n=1 Tax=Labrys miyagiensis TaxID=346912 RepID=A0ABQ6CG36_9HYPH|nr:DNA topoisomerase IB [Labrys miyagiensis]GLS19322.1 DNA topoisomerase [Labrys miyagiensis]